MQHRVSSGNGSQLQSDRGFSLYEVKAHIIALWPGSHQPPTRFRIHAPGLGLLRQQRPPLCRVVDASPMVAQGRLQQVGHDAGLSLRLKRDEVVTVFPSSVIPKHPVEVPPLDRRIVGSLVLGEEHQRLRRGRECGRWFRCFRRSRSGRRSNRRRRRCCRRLCRAAHDQQDSNSRQGYKKGDGKPGGLEGHEERSKRRKFRRGPML